MVNFTHFPNDSHCSDFFSQSHNNKYINKNDVQYNLLNILKYKFSFL